MIISHKYKFIFVKTAKTAGTSIEVFLDKYCGEDDVLTPFAFPEEGHRSRNYKGFFNPIPEVLEFFKNDQALFKNFYHLTRDFIIGKKFYHHIPAWQIRKRVTKKMWDTYYKFTIERNPWDKVISGWLYQMRRYNREISLDDYIHFCERRSRSKINGTGVCPANYWTYMDPDTEDMLVDKVIYYENLDQQFMKVLQDIGINSKKALDVYAKKSVDRKDYHDYYNDENKEKVAKLFKKEIDLHNYTF